MPWSGHTTNSNMVQRVGKVKRPQPVFFSRPYQWPLKKHWEWRWWLFNTIIYNYHVYYDDDPNSTNLMDLRSLFRCSWVFSSPTLWHAGLLASNPFWVYLRRTERDGEGSRWDMWDPPDGYWRDLESFVKQILLIFDAVMGLPWFTWFHVFWHHFLRFYIRVQLGSWIFPAAIVQTTAFFPKHCVHPEGFLRWAGVRFLDQGTLSGARFFCWL